MFPESTVFKCPLTSTSYQLPWHFEGVEFPTVKEVEKEKQKQTQPLPSLPAPSSNWLEFNTQLRNEVWEYGCSERAPEERKGRILNRHGSP